MRFRPLIMVCGANELGTAVAHRLFRAQCRCLIIGSDDPLTLMRGNSFAQAAFSGIYEVEGLSVSRAVVTEASTLLERNVLPLLTADCRSVVEVLNPDIIVQARCPRSTIEISVGDASLVIGIGDGFDAGENCDQVIHAGPGHDLGRIIYRGTTAALPSSGQGKEERPFVKAAGAGPFMPQKKLGQAVAAGDLLARIGEGEVKAPESGVISAILNEGVEVSPDAVVAEVDVRANEEACYTISGQGRAVSGGVLESVAAWIADMGAFSRE